MLIMSVSVSLFQILLAFALMTNILVYLYALPVTVKGCNGKPMKIHRPKKKLQTILNDYMVVVNAPPAPLTANNVYSIKPSVRCPFKVEIPAPVDDRIPKYLPQATCNNCPPKCKPVEIKKPVLKRKCHPELGKVYTFIEETVRIGYVYER